MRKLYALVGLFLLGFASQAQTCTTTISNFPYFQNFENGAGGWTASGANSSWALGTPAKSIINSAGSGTNSWVTNLAGLYNADEVSEVVSPCFNTTGLTTPIVEMKVWWSTETDYDGAVLQSSIDNGATWQNVGAFGNPNNWFNNDEIDTQPGGSAEGWSGTTTNSSGGWVTAKHALTGLGNKTNLRLRIAFASDFIIHSDGFAFDDVAVYDLPTVDAGISAITSPNSGCSLSTQENICITISNFGLAPLTSVPVSYTLNNGTPVNETFTGNIPVNGTANYCFTTKANMSTVGTYTLVATANLSGDGLPSNNSFTKTVTSFTTISSFPYFQNFESGAGGWTAGGVNSTWALGTPAKTVINSAGSGANSWVTSLTGTYAADEDSYVVGPCFNLSGITLPIFEMKIWWNNEFSYDGAVLQSSVDGGVTWQKVGAMGDPNNWYNDNSIAAGPGGQPGATAEGWSGTNANSSGGWVTAKHVLNGLGNNPSVMLRIAFAGDDIVHYDGIAFDDVSVYDSPANDLELVALTSPVLNNTTCSLSATETVCISVKNNGSAAQSNFPVSFQIGTATPVVETVPGPLAAGATMTYCFTAKGDFSTPGSVNVIVKTLLANDGLPTNDTKTVSVTNPIITAFPYIQDFEGATVGNGSNVPGTLPAGWSVNPTGAPAFPYMWLAHAGGTSSTATGPNVDNTLGTASGKYMYAEASNGITSDVAELLTPCINLAGLTTPGIDFYYHMAGLTIGTLSVEVSTNNGNTWTSVFSLTGSQQANENDAWRKQTVSLNGYSGIVKLRFKATRGTSFDGDIAIDDIKIYNIPASDAAITGITTPVSGCGLTATETICINIKNNGNAPISSVPVSYAINSGSAVNEIVAGPIAVGATFNYCFTTKANMGTPGTYTIVAAAALPSDGDPSNNSFTKTVTAIPSISTFPYSEGFENGAGGWTSGGTNSSWALGTPAKTVINSAGSGTKSWVTNLTGSYNNSEQSYVVGPCFNFSGMPDPDFEMKIFWDAETSYDGAVLQSSIDGGATWQNVGAMNDPNSVNWFNDNTIAAGPGGQPGSTAEGWTGTGTGWVTAKHKLTNLGGQSSVLLRIAFGEDGIVYTYDGFAFDDVRIGDNTGNLAVIAVTPLTKVCGFNNNEPIQATIENLGSVPANGITMSYTVNGGTPVTQPFTGPLAPGTPTTFTFTQGADLSAPGVYTITVTISAAGDPELANNTVTYTISNASFPSLPPFLDFETAATGLPATRVITGNNATIVEGTGASNGSNSTEGMIMAGVTNANWQIPAGGSVDPWAVNMEHIGGSYICFSPAGGAPSDSLWLTFDLKQLFKTANANTNFRVTVDGVQVGPTYRPPFNPANPSTPIAWQKVKIDLSAYKNLSNIQIGLESSVAEPYANGAGPANLVDNVRVVRRIVLGSKDDVLNRTLNVFPNPSAGKFKVNLPQGKGFALEVTDLAGKTLKTQQANGGQHNLDLSGYPTGIYLLKVASKDGLAVRKLVIE